jgi:hypothetical protein
MSDIVRKNIRDAIAYADNEMRHANDSKNRDDYNYAAFCQRTAIYKMLTAIQLELSISNDRKLN